MTGFHNMQARGIRVALDLAFGQLARFEVQIGGRWTAPLARVPWADAPPKCEAIDRGPHLARMTGDFFCAPFGRADIEDAPPHGWTANAAWELVAERTLPDGCEARFVLSRPVIGARVEKIWRLRDGHPFLYQSHVFTGGAGALSMAHHVMVDVGQGARLHLSPRAWAETPDTPLEPDPSRGRFALQYPARTTDPTQFPLAGGGTADLTRYPLAQGHEDFVMLVDPLPATPGAAFAWSVVQRAQGDAVVLIKDRRTLPQTMLWISNGGRDYAPWSGRHVGVLGIEDACAWSAYGHHASAQENALMAQGYRTAHDLQGGKAVVIHHALGVADAAGAAAITLDIGAEAVLLRNGASNLATLPFDAAHFDSA